MKTFTVYTTEADDPDAAWADIEGQLASCRLAKNSIGIVTCFADFIGSGTLAAIAGKLPFPLAGITTMASAAPGVTGEVLLVITVMTADDAEFVTAVTGPVTSEDMTALKAAWETSGGLRQDRPALMFTFAPLSFSVPADFFAEAWAGIEELRGVPNFGSEAVDHNPDYAESRVFFGGEAWQDRCVLVFCYGNLRPAFFIGGVPEAKAFREKGVVTSSRGNQLRGVNGVSTMEYLLSLGLKKDEGGSIPGVNAYPLLLDDAEGDETVIRVMFAVTPDGSAVCGGKIPEGTAFSIGSLFAPDVLASSKKVLAQAAAYARTSGRGALIFSCIGRYFAQGFDTEAEMKLAAEAMGTVPFHLAYSGTELCPVHGKDGSLINRSHNDTMVICVL